MLSSAKIGTDSWQYYVDQEPCRAVEYYAGREPEAGRWTGRGLERFGLEEGAAVGRGQLEALFGRGVDPSSGKVLGRAWRKDGVTGYDLTFSAPKSVSVLALSASDSAREVPSPMRSTGTEAIGARAASTCAVSGHGVQLALLDPPEAGSRNEVGAVVRGAHGTAIKAALAYLDGHASLSRRGTNGVEQVATGGFTAALFEHATSRDGDPQLHTHALVLNKVQCADGTWRTLDGHEIYAHKKSAGMLYQAILRNELTRGLGVAWSEVSKDGQAEILGVPERLLELWSKRTHAVTKEASEAIAGYEQLLGRDLTGPERASVTKTAVLKTRSRKTHERPEHLLGRWRAEAASVDVNLEQLLPAAQAAARQAAEAGDRVAGPLRMEDVAARALEAAGRSRAVFSRADVTGQIARFLPTLGLPADEVVRVVEQLADTALGLSDAISVGAPALGATARGSDARFATVEVLGAEARILRTAREGQGQGVGQASPVGMRELLTALPQALDHSQLQAVLHLVRSGDRLEVLTAPAGAGKTNTLGAAAAIWQHNDYRVVGLAPSARAAAELTTALAAAGGVTGPAGRADTLAKWLHTRHQQPDLDSHSPDLTGRDAWARLDARTVLLVDEASMVSTLDLDALTQAAAAAGAKVVLIGDPAQIGVIDGPGGMLAHLARNGHALALTDIHRFTADWEKDATLQLRAGRSEVLATYQQQGRLHACPDGDTAADELFAHWQQARAQGQDALMLARTRLDVDALNQRARLHALETGQLTGQALEVGGREWQTGDLLRTRKNQRHLPVGDGHVRNGDRYRVLGSSPDGGLVVEDLTGRGRTTLPESYVAKHCEYGWAATIDGSQGATADLGLVLVRPGLDREHLYVAMTRGRHGNHAYLTPDTPEHPDHDIHSRPAHRCVEDVRDLQAECLNVLQVALATSGAQESAHTALARARDLAQARDAKPARTKRRDQAAPAAPPVPARIAQLEQQLKQVSGTLTVHQTALGQVRHERDLVTGQLSTLPRWASGRRKALTSQLTDLTTRHKYLATAAQATRREIDTLEAELATLQRASTTRNPTTAPSPGSKPAPRPEPSPATLVQPITDRLAPAGRPSRHTRLEPPVTADRVHGRDRGPAR